MNLLNNTLAEEYLSLLGVVHKKPDMDYLRELVFSHLTKIPFENISKIYYKLKYGLNYIPEVEQYLEGIRKYHFGGTCYANNFYFNQLLKYLGFNVMLCGADMRNPDVHIVNVVKLDEREYLVDVGYGAPFFEPIPLNLSEDYIINFGIEKYILKSKNERGFSKMEQYRNNELSHGYLVKPYPRKIEDFVNVIKASFNESATFMNAIVIILFGKNSSKIINNLSSIEVLNGSYSKRKLSNKDELINEIENIFEIPKGIVEQVVNRITHFEDAWH